jgi:transcriptional regulator with XRE-family HTH domain
MEIQMSAVRITRGASSNQLRALLRTWRDARGVSQLELSVAANLSQRHVSFIEGGRSLPGRATLLRMAQALDMPLRERNTLLLAAGYAPLYPESDLNGPAMRMIKKALERMLHRHEPFPAIVMDRYWNVLATNASAPKFFGCFVDMAARQDPRNLLQLMFDPAGLRPFIANWQNTASALVGRIYREAVGQVPDEKTEALLAALLADAGIQSGWQAHDALDSWPVVPVSLAFDGHTLNYFSMISTVAAPQMVAAEELRVECLFPADRETGRRHRAMMNALNHAV